MVFDSFRKNISDKTRVRIFILFVAQNKYSNSRVVRKQIAVRNNFFPQNLTLGYMTKSLNQIIFFSSTKIRIFFQQHWESKYCFRKRPNPLEVKWSVPYHNIYLNE